MGNTIDFYKIAKQVLQGWIKFGPQWHENISLLYISCLCKEVSVRSGISRACKNPNPFSNFQLLSGKMSPRLFNFSQCDVIWASVSPSQSGFSDLLILSLATAPHLVMPPSHCPCCKAGLAHVSEAAQERVRLNHNYSVGFFLLWLFLSSSHTQDLNLEQGKRKAPWALQTQAVWCATQIIQQHLHMPLRGFVLLFMLFQESRYT